MKKFFSLSLFIFGMAVVLCAQTPQWVNPLPTGQPINDIAFFDAAHALMCGKNGALLSSSDGGNTWLEQSQGDFANFFQIEITGAASALVRAESFLLKTDDYGNSFSVVGTMPAGTTYKKISMYSPTQGYALRTTPSLSQPFELGFTADGGLSWNWQPFPPKFRDVKEIFFTDPMNGFCIAKINMDEYYIFQTTDGGQTWQSTYGLYNAPDAAILTRSSSGALFCAYTYVYASDYETEILKSTDGGLTWNSILSSSLGGGIFVSEFKTLGDFLFLAAILAWDKDNVQDQQYNLLYSNDGGTTWLKATAPMGYDLTAPFALGLKNTNEAFIYEDNFGQIFRTFTTGQFEPFSPANFSRHISDISFSENKGYIFCPEWGYGISSTWMSDDGGNSWTALPATVEGVPFRGVFTAANYGYLCTQTDDYYPKVKIYKTSNGAQSYELLKTYNTADPLLLDAFGPDTVIMLTASHGNPLELLLVRSFDGGMTWTENPFIGSKILTGDFFDGLHGCLMGGDNTGQALVTSDGGNTWTPYSLPTAAITAVQMISPTIVFFKTSEAGISKLFKLDLNTLSLQEIFSALPGTFISDFTFSNQEIGYIITVTSNYEESQLHQTTDGGNSWTLAGVYNHLFFVKSFYGENGFAFGDKGRLLRLGNGYPLSAPAVGKKPQEVSIMPLAAERLLQVNVTPSVNLPGILRIFDIKGALVQQFVVSSHVQSISHRLKPGLYLFNFEGTKNTSSGKFMITE